MSTYARSLIAGSVALVLFDAAAAIEARLFGFAYTRAAIGSYLICIVVGYFIGRDTKSRRALHAVGAGSILGFSDATLGWAVGASLGAGKPHRHLTPNTWIVICFLVMVTYTLFTALGYCMALWVHRSHASELPITEQ